jgi:hypothetical protein
MNTWFDNEGRDDPRSVEASRAAMRAAARAIAVLLVLFVLFGGRL